MISSRVPLFWFVGFFILFFACETHAGDDDSGQGEDALLSMGLEELLNTPVEVWSATKTKSTTDEAPSVITVISRQEIEVWSYRSLADALQHVVGFYVIDDHILPNLGVRGVGGGLLGESGTIKLMIDGRSVVFHSTSGNWLGAELIPLTAIERIEIIRGPVSALYGADAFLAVINVVTRSGESLDGADADGYMFTTEERHISGGFDTSFGGRKGKVDVLVSAKFERDDRSGLKLPDSSPAPSIPVYNAERLSSRELVLDSKVALLKLQYQLNKKHQLTFMGYLSLIERGAEFSAWAPLSYGYTDTGALNYSTVALYNSILALSYSARFTDSFQLDTKIHYFTGGPRDDDRIEVGSTVYYIRREFGYKGIDGSVEGKWSYKDNVTFVVGTEILFDREDLPSTLRVLKSASGDYDTGDELASSANRQGEADFLNYGAFSQAIFKPVQHYL
ncbi:MAG: TonB-dependent receptor plug domain-containing protein, partial [Deltaproteobacteria bacterium]|nr:TonB-dependent receptor plug domain-containing protein [Deltaproteobacteria bacterium]